MSDLGLNTLTDDQLVELSRAIAAEFVKRNPAVADAAQSAIRDEIARAAQSQDNLWAKKKWLALMVVDHVGSGCELTVWRAADRGITRVYLDEPSSDRRGRDRVKWCLHVTGDSKHPPGTLTKDEGSRASSSADDDVVKIICQHAVRSFASVRINCDQATATEYNTPPMPEDYTLLVAALAKAAATKAARDAHYKQARERIFENIESDENAALVEHGKQWDWQLPENIREPLKARKEVARGALDEIMAEYDRQNGGTQ